MKFVLLTVSLFLFAAKLSAQKIYATSKGHISFFANAPIADVDAQNDKVNIVINTLTGELAVAVDMRAFRFKNKKMGRDAIRSYIEIDKFPRASFNGKITGNVEYDKPGSYPVRAAGKLKIHGVENEATAKGTIHIKKKQIRIQSEFDVALEDHDIERPKILGQEMTDDKVLVSVDARLSPKSK